MKETTIFLYVKLRFGGQVEAARAWGVSQSTVSGAIAGQSSAKKRIFTAIETVDKMPLHFFERLEDHLISLETAHNKERIAMGSEIIKYQQKAADANTEYLNLQRSLKPGANRYGNRG